MSPAGKGRGWRETQVRLARATVTTFDGPGADFLVVVAGARKGAKRVTRQAGAPHRPAMKGAR